MLYSLEVIEGRIALVRLRITYFERALDVLREHRRGLEDGELAPDDLDDALSLLVGPAGWKTNCGVYEEIISAHERPMRSGEILAVALDLGLRQRGSRSLREEVRVALYRCESLYRVRRDLWWIVGRELPTGR